MADAKTTTKIKQNFSISFIRNQPLLEVQTTWCALYENAQPNFFLSWDWIGTWLSSINTPYIICVAKLNEETVGLGVLIENKTCRNVFVRSKQLLLHQTGKQDKDQIWIEYNDFLLDARFTAAVRTEFVHKISEQLEWDEFVIGAAKNEVLSAFRALQIQEHQIWNSRTYKVNLASLRLNQTAYLDTLSKNTRYQINRSIKEYKKLGHLELKAARSTEEALDWLKEAAVLHIERWGNTNTKSGFINPYFVAFHQQLIKTYFSKGSLEIIKVQAGHELIAYLYNFIQGSEVKFYLCANNFSMKNQKLKPGLVSQCMAIEYYLGNGFSSYDFMGGESQYKRSLSPESDVLSITVFSKPKFVFKIESTLKKIKYLIRSRPLNNR